MAGYQIDLRDGPVFDSAPGRVLPDRLDTAFVKNVFERLTPLRRFRSPTVPSAHPVARLRALKMGPLVMALLAMLSIIPVVRSPNDRPGGLPAGRSNQGGHEMFSCSADAPETPSAGGCLCHCPE